MIDRKTRARAIAELHCAVAQSIESINNVLGGSDLTPEEAAANENMVCLAVGGLVHAEAELMKALELIRAAKALQQIAVRS